MPNSYHALVQALLSVIVLQLPNVKQISGRAPQTFRTLYTRTCSDRKICDLIINTFQLTASIKLSHSSLSVCVNEFTVPICVVDICRSAASYTLCLRFPKLNRLVRLIGYRDLSWGKGQEGKIDGGCPWTIASVYEGKLELFIPVK